ncbi:cache domain-containing protein [Ectothiorhodospiraceae bacterium 2226]|nr:cache domain-containing protein [Ectothiorhodospiraceae bacterium 2226]
MTFTTFTTFRAAALATCLHVVLGGAAHATQERPFAVDGEVALAAFIALSDGHLIKVADSLHIFAQGEAARSAAWGRIKDPYADVAERNVSALNWFALPDGAYWSVQEGKAEGNLAERSYFPRVLAGETIIGELVVSKATGKPVAIVAVPVMGDDEAVVGVLGASVYLDRLSDLIREQMSLDESTVFYSFDRAPLVALDWDPGLIFLDPRRLGEPDLIRAFEEMLAADEGVVNYTFRGRERTAIFRHSPVTDWWYVLGVVPQGREAPSGEISVPAGSGGD